MALEAFTEQWAQAWQGELNKSENYQKAARSWEWPLVLVMEADAEESIPDRRAIYADLYHGVCRAAHLASPDELRDAPYVISADPHTWHEVLDGRQEAISGIMRGRLVLTRGNMVVLARYVLAATELVRAAVRIDSVFPKDLDG